MYPFMPSDGAFDESKVKDDYREGEGVTADYRSGTRLSGADVDRGGAGAVVRAIAVVAAVTAALMRTGVVAR